MVVENLKAQYIDYTQAVSIMDAIQVVRNFGDGSDKYVEDGKLNVHPSYCITSGRSVGYDTT